MKPDEPDESAASIVGFDDRTDQAVPAAVNRRNCRSTATGLGSNNGGTTPGNGRQQQLRDIVAVLQDPFRLNGIAH
jgi:hypothetical protein